ncbi:hypothetical protein VIBNISFn118_470087 [Vibrio nigripulchritudo SFn118]|nr:hypothetical protein VIBNISFn118_470087 [Vibrio nigripulchritudo SFn118]
MESTTDLEKLCSAHLLTENTFGILTSRELVDLRVYLLSIDSELTAISSWHGVEGVCFL